MSEQKDVLIEQLADKEHASWARWMAYQFSRCEPLPDGSLVLPFPLVEHWQRQVETPYEQLTEREKQSDRDEVAHILPIIEQRAEALEKLLRDALLYIKELSDYNWRSAPRTIALQDRAAVLGIVLELKP